MKTCNKDSIKEKELPKGDALSLPKGWEVKKLIDIAEVSTGKWNANHANKTGKYRFYTCAYKHGMCDTKRFSGKTLILPGNGVNVGEVFYYEGEFDAYQRTYVIFNINISPKYLHYHMRLFWKELGTKLQYGSATNFIKIGNFENYSVEHPPLPEQKRIVASLDQAFTAIDQAKANTEKNLGNARELFQSKLQETFANGKLKIESGEWKEKKLGEVCLVIAGQSPEGKYYNSEGNGLPFHQGKKEFSRKFIGEPVKWTTKVTKEAEENDILMSVRAPVGPINFSTQKICIGRGLAAIRANELIDKEFLFDFLLKNENEIVGNTGAVFNSINKNQIKNISIPVPPLPEQKQIVKNLDAVSTETKKLETIYQIKITCLDELKKSILQKAFNGEL